MGEIISADTIVGIVGAGAMGSGIAQLVATAGHRVRLLDSRAGAVDQAITDIGLALSQGVDKGKLDATAAQAAQARLLAASRLDELSDCGLVIEAIVEDLTAKQRLFSDLEALVSAECLFATNTSSISVTAIGAALRSPQRLAGLHFFNPAPRMALVEVISGLATDPGLADTLRATALAWGKTPVTARSTPGFIVNRVARPYYGEALRLLDEGAGDAATLDAIFREAGGFRMGPFELMDLIGLDVNLAVSTSVWRAFHHDPRYAPSLIQQELVAAGYLGRKSGRGFHRYGDNVAPASANTLPLQPALPSPALVFAEGPLAESLRDRLQARGLPFQHAGTSPDGRVAEAGGAVLYLTDGRTATERAARKGVSNTVLVDLALDYGKATRLAIATAEQCSPAAAGAAAGLLQTAGFAVSRLADVAGLAVMRTVCMLANEAADAVHQSVCDAAAVDQAMLLGTHYPLGPLAWAEQIGLRKVRRVLANLAASYGEDRYRVSPLLARKVFSRTNFHA
ncbi:MAG: 3-hydroxyacyl-CoA dehydrogenase [Candidatus Accumulibacter sp.]|nr:3-hydroxyacyl-CoA dehydrogenase [Accumulibacter sp.]